MGLLRRIASRNDRVLYHVYYNPKTNLTCFQSHCEDGASGQSNPI